MRLGIRQQESGGDYTIANFDNTSHGAYQFKPRYWLSWAVLLGDDEAAEYPKASDAPPAIQDRMAAAALQHMWEKNTRLGKDWERLIAAWFTGEADPLLYGDKKYWTVVPGGSSNPANPSIRKYVDSVLAHIKEIQ